METFILKTSAFHMTEEEFFDFCQQNDTLHIERNENGEIIVSEPSGNYTSMLNIKLVTKLENWNEQYQLGYAFNTDAGFTLPNHAVLSPDAAWIRKERFDSLSEADKERFAHICPDFVIELKSPSDSLKDLKLKMLEWIQNGCRFALLINPQEQRVLIYRENGTTEDRSFREKISGEEILPGFELDLNFIKI
ncbi:MAG: Uma2 family endonuclease [Chitinophagales bacterium]|nr:Uma2 family endonuclease [Chitinophagales bacterium]